MRRTFLVFGGIPGGWLAGRFGAVMGTFIASGLYHELGFYMINRGLDHRTTLFFVLQGVAMILERAYTSVTGSRVGGWKGRIWAYFWVLVVGQICSKWFPSS